MKFIVKIPCKPYSRHFLEINYLDAESGVLNIFPDKIFYNMLREKLKKQSLRRETIYNKFEKYKDEVSIYITQDDFYRYGWDLSKTDIVTINKFIEGKVKILLYTIVGSYVAIGIPLSESISLFQEKYKFTEDIWSRDSIYKDCIRNLEVEKNSISKELFTMIDKICLDKLSLNGTICQQAKSIWKE